MCSGIYFVRSIWARRQQHQHPFHTQQHSSLQTERRKKKTLTQTHSEKKRRRTELNGTQKMWKRTKKKVALDSTVPVSRCTSVPLLLYIAHRYFVFYMCSKCWIRIFKSNRKKNNTYCSNNNKYIYPRFHVSIYFRLSRIHRHVSYGDWALAVKFTRD